MQTVSLYRAIYDERFPESIAFARQAQAHSVRVHGMSGDITSFWYHELDPQWRRRPLADTRRRDPNFLRGLE